MKGSLTLCTAAIAAAGALTMTVAYAAGSSPDNLSAPADVSSMTPKQAYDHDRAYCLSDQATESRDLCLKEARRAYREARMGTLTTATGESRSDRMAAADSSVRPARADRN